MLPIDRTHLTTEKVSLFINEYVEGRIRLPTYGNLITKGTVSLVTKEYAVGPEFLTVAYLRIGLD